MKYLKKYRWKNRLLIIYTPDYINNKYLKAKKIYYENIKDFHKRYLKLLVIIEKGIKFSISIIGFDGNEKKKYNKISKQKIFNLLDKMPMKDKRINPVNLSLYANYNPKTSKKNLGYVSKKKSIRYYKKYQK